jgi:hypothetical protein
VHHPEIQDRRGTEGDWRFSAVRPFWSSETMSPRIWRFSSGADAEGDEDGAVENAAGLADFFRNGHRG